MENDQKLPIKHHYIPQFYLRGFSQDNEHLHIFDKEAVAEEARFRYQTTQAIAYKKNFYTYETKDRNKETLEGMFSQIEGKAQTAIRRLSDGLELDREYRSHGDPNASCFELFFPWIYKIMLAYFQTISPNFYN